MLHFESINEKSFRNNFNFWISETNLLLCVAWKLTDVVQVTSLH